LIDLHKSVSASIQRRQKLQAKRITLGHKPDNHEGKQMQGGMVMDGVHSSLPLRNTNPYGFWSGAFSSGNGAGTCAGLPPFILPDHPLYSDQSKNSASAPPFL